MLIRLLEKENNRRGDLFGRLMADLFVSLGYEQPRLNIHKSGRELDLSADHSLEPRRAIGECKCTTEQIGGDDINKFAGALDVEQSDGRSVSGYFISLSGFKETAIEQEKSRRTKIILLTGPQVIDHLIRGNVIKPEATATEVAGRCCVHLDRLTLDPEAELLGHQRGWIWAIYYAEGKARTAFVLVHSDGTPLARTIAEEVIAADRQCGGSLSDLNCLNPAPLRLAEADQPPREALDAYRKYIDDECGSVHLDGMPADSDVGSRRLKLEHLFVPLHVTVHRVDDASKLARVSLGVALASHPRLALLSAPGGGKSTVIKRLAVAYADPDRRHQIADDLPEQDCLPLFFRCRELRGLSRSSFSELLDALSQREGIRQHAAAFRAHADRALLAGKALLLIDGLDEISDPGDRAAFVCTLRAALRAYPRTGLVVTSREAGFRHVAAHLAPVCPQATLEPLDHSDIARLCVAWHREVVGDSEKVRNDAKDLAVAIIKNDRIERLAINPLLLTTLLLVKRWVGTLPTRRAVLYGKAVELLLMTWNTEAYDPIPEEEAMPQLCYVASAMMLDGVQKISRPKLASLLEEARAALPAELAYVKGSVDQFIQRIEYRSSLLMMTGLDVEDGRLVEFYEFRHLTFQEFLTARAFVEGWYRDRKENDTLGGLLAPHFREPKWGEVIPLAAVLGGRASEALIQNLTFAVENLSSASAAAVLGSCLADEAPARPATVRRAVEVLIPFCEFLSNVGILSTLARGRYAGDVREVAGAALTSRSDVENASRLLFETVWPQTLESDDTEGYIRAMRRVGEMLNSPDPLIRCEGALALAHACRRFEARPFFSDSYQLATHLEAMLSGSDAEVYASAWAAKALGSALVWQPPVAPDILQRLFKLCCEHNNSSVRKIAAEAICAQPLASREEGRCAMIQPYEVEYALESVDSGSAMIIAWYTKSFSDASIRAKMQRREFDHFSRGIRDLEVALSGPRPDAPDLDYQ